MLLALTCNPWSGKFVSGRSFAGRVAERRFRVAQVAQPEVRGIVRVHRSLQLPIQVAGQEDAAVRARVHGQVGVGVDRRAARSRRREDAGVGVAVDAADRAVRREGPLLERGGAAEAVEHRRRRVRPRRFHRVVRQIGRIEFDPLVERELRRRLAGVRRELGVPRVALQAELVFERARRHERVGRRRARRCVRGRHARRPGDAARGRPSGRRGRARGCRGVVRVVAVGALVVSVELAGQGITAIRIVTVDRGGIVAIEGAVGGVVRGAAAYAASIPGAVTPSWHEPQAPSCGGAVVLSSDPAARCALWHAAQLSVISP